MIKKILLFLCVFAIATAFIGCSNDKANNTSGADADDKSQAVSDSDEKNTVSQIEDIINFESDEDNSHEDYSETNEKYDNNGNVTLSKIYSPTGELIGYRNYEYNSSSKIVNMKTYTNDNILKSTICYEYNNDNTVVSVINDKGTTVLKIVTEIGGNEKISYYNEKEKLIFTQIPLPSEGDAEGYDENGERLSDEEYSNYLKKIQEILHSNLFW